MNVLKKNFKSPTFEISETHEHPEGGDRGGYAEETHSFVVVDGTVTHEYGVGVDEPENYGVEQESLRTKDEAIAFVRSNRTYLEEQLEHLKELEELLLNKAVEDFHNKFFFNIDKMWDKIWDS